ncbi:MAG: MmgE/PrpD family protein [Alphaproteobacteria bacterium]|jgi:2-methylcitrate dehydratase PrpD|nr:MmgE/PrpD family protein [Alphaproteobacteria bacterium]MDP6566536.1 MmgE/PrpD family protein [Alphaproteobacteria bacterium]MDP6815956.1 MmgE/PrpD family protein [Alphaproteobacteria bacterium]
MSIASIAEQPQPVTEALAERTAGLTFDDLDPDSLAVAKQCLIDWFAVTLAGAREPLTGMLLAEAAEEGGRERATLIGGGKGTLAQAALINGAASHALDYDDVNQAMGGHPTVPVVPAVLALAEDGGLSGRDLLTAFVAGYETECRVGTLVAPSHYEKGFHATATVGSFGAAAGAARLLGLDTEGTARAMGIAATQAAGLKSQFGTMCKPLHAGKAASNGLLAAKLAARGFTSRPDMLETAQGFAATQSDEFRADRALEAARRGFFVRENLFKYHAACYLTHSTIEAMGRLRQEHGIGPDDVVAATLRVDNRHLNVCNIQEPSTGLEVKFSLRHTAAFGLAGEDTARIENYSDSNATRPDLEDLRRRITVEPSGGPGTLATAVVELTDGRKLEETVDVGVPAEDVADQGNKIDAKYRSLVEPLLGEATGPLLDDLHGLEDLADCRQLTAHLADWRA